MIRDGWIESERVAQLDPAAERFFLRLCLRADDFGRYHANPALLRSNLFPLMDAIKTAQISPWLKSCEKAGLVVTYQHDGKQFLYIPKFNQRMRAAISRFPEPPTNGAHVTGLCQTDDGHMPDKRRPESESESESESEGEGEAKAEGESEADGHVTADKIYALYPRKQGRESAIRAINLAIRRGVDPFRLLERVTAYAAATAKWSESDRQYIPHPTTWFNRGNYDDDPKTWERQTPGANRHQMRVATKEEHLKDGWEFRP